MIKQEEKEQGPAKKLTREEYEEIQANKHDNSPRLQELRVRLRTYGLEQ